MQQKGGRLWRMCITTHKRIERVMRKQISKRRSQLAVSVLAGSLMLGGCGTPEDDNKKDSGSKVQTGYISVADMSVSEGDQKADRRVEVRLSVTQDKPVKVSYETKDGSAVAGEDYDNRSGVLEFPPGVRAAFIDVPIIGDNVHEPDEYFELHLSDAVNAKIKSSESKAAITIVNDDERPTVSFESAQQSVAEDVGETRIIAKLSEKSGYTVEADLEVQGTALRGDDYEIHQPLTLSFLPGVTEASLDVSILMDDLPEGGETIKVTFDEIKEASATNKAGIVEHTIIILGDNALNDTGLTTFSDGVVANLHAEPATHPGQDASFGRDAGFQPNSDGHAGFSFTKLDSSGNPLPSNAPIWECSRDNVTGLVWENKKPDQDLKVTVVEVEEGQDLVTVPTIKAGEFRAGNFIYAWRNDDPKSNGGSAGVVESSKTQLNAGNPVTAHGAAGYPSKDELPGYCGYEQGTGGTNCNTRVYVEQMNTWGVCGFNDWRMPEVEELRSLANHAMESDVALPETGFLSNLKENVTYLSNTPSADNESSAWCYDYKQGEVKLCRKGTYHGVMAVRNKQ